MKVQSAKSLKSRKPHFRECVRRACRDEISLDSAISPARRRISWDDPSTRLDFSL